MIGLIQRLRPIEMSRCLSMLITLVNGVVIRLLLNLERISSTRVTSFQPDVFLFQRREISTEEKKEKKEDGTFITMVSSRI